MVHETRIIPLDGRRPLSSSFRHYMGEPRGHWDGNTLVVETTNFRDEPAYRGANPETVRFVERFTPTSPGTLEWSVTVDDPGTWTRPWTFAMPLTRNDKEAVFEYACHEGNMAMANVLSAARAEERAPSVPPARSGSTATSAPTNVRRSEASATPAAGLLGTWQAADRPPNFAGYSTATRLVIRESANQIVVESNTGTENQMQVAVYPLDGSENGVPGPVGWNTTARASRQDGRLIVTATRTIDGPDGRLTFTIKDVYSESGGILTLDRTQGPRTQRTTYSRAP
jgi:hypothetical protein